MNMDIARFVMHTLLVTHRTTIELDEALLREAQHILGTTGIKDTVETAFRELARSDRRRRLALRIRTGAGVDRGEQLLAQTRPDR